MTIEESELSSVVPIGASVNGFLVLEFGVGHTDDAVVVFENIGI
jgi:hypothetical protein